jgi:hypothetical protein
VRLFNAVFWAGLLLACPLLFCGCGGEEFTPETNRELMPGRGLLSGEDGEFTIWGKSAAEREADEAQAEQEGNGEEQESNGEEQESSGREE